MRRHVHGTRAPGPYSAPGSPGSPRVASGTHPQVRGLFIHLGAGLTLRRLTSADRAASALARTVQGGGHPNPHPAPHPHPDP